MPGYKPFQPRFDFLFNSYYYTQGDMHPRPTVEEIYQYRSYSEAGESLHTGNSYKYTPEEFISMASKSGFRDVRHWVDSGGLFAIYLLGSVLKMVF